MNLYKLASIFLLKSAASLEETLDSLGISQEIKSFILSSGKNIPKYISILKQFPNSSIQDLQSQDKVYFSKFDELNNKYGKKLVDEVLRRNPPKDEYLDWMLAQIVAGANIDQVDELIRFYDKYDDAFEELNEYNFSSLKDEVEKFKVNEGKMRSNAQILYEDDKFILVRPDDRNACISYGRRSTWCMSDPEDPKAYNIFSTANDVFYIVLNKLNKSKLAFRFNRNDGEFTLAEAQNRRQDPSDLSESAVRKYLGSSYDNIYSIILGDIPKAPDSEKFKELRVELTRIEDELLSGKDVHYDEKIMLMENRRKLSPEIQMILANDDDPEVKRELAPNPNIIPEAQVLLANDNEPEVRKNFALSNKNIIPEAQMLLANDDDPVVRKNFASFDRNIIPEAQILLANDDDPEVRKSFAYFNKNKIAEAQMLLANDNDPVVRRYFANNKNIITEAQMLLANDNDPKVRKVFANYKNMIPKAQMLLANDDVPEIKRYFALYNRNIIPEVQMLLANDNDPEVRSALRKNRKLTPEAKAILDSRN